MNICTTCGKSFGKGIGMHRIACQRRYADAQFREKQGQSPGAKIQLMAVVHSHKHPLASVVGDARPSASTSQPEFSTVAPPIAHDTENYDSNDLSIPLEVGDIGAEAQFPGSGDAFDTHPESTPNQPDGNVPQRPRYPSGEVMETFPALNDIYTLYHPSSGRPPKIVPFHEHGRHQHTPLIPKECPWEPFRTRLDFEILELAKEVGLNNVQLDRYIKLVHKAVELRDYEDQRFTVQSMHDAEKLWELAASRRVGFKTEKVSAMYKQQERSYDFSFREPWDWAVEIIKDPSLRSHLIWDAEKAYIWDGEKWERFYDEPWTSDAWWDAQSLLPSEVARESKLVPFILYADKAILSSFGTAKGHPIIARLANLPVSIRNKPGIGGGCVVGWLPMVHEETSETGKKNFVNFKNAVYHSSFRKFLEKVAEYSHVGCKTCCGDELWRLLWPFVLIVSADYEEFSVITLIRGLGGHFPCPVCLVPRSLQFNLSKNFPLRTQTGSQEIYTEATGMRTIKLCDDHLKKYSLRPVENAFWAVNLTDIHAATSYDCLHSDDNGLWEDHFFPLFKTLVNSRDDISAIDQRFSAMPRWSGLNHFESVMNITFNDGSKNKDISKIFLFASQAILSRDRKSEAYHLLRCLRHYLNVRMYADFDLHTDSTIQAAEEELEERFYPSLVSYLKLVGAPEVNEATPNAPNVLREPQDATTSDEEDGSAPHSIGRTLETNRSSYLENADEHSEVLESKKSWNFPKIHLRKHLFQDIRAKGVTRNYSTKPNEQMHGPIRKLYHRTNFKDYGDQILKANHALVVAGLIRNQIDLLDEHQRTISAISQQDTCEEIVIPPISSMHTADSTTLSTLDQAEEEYSCYRKLGSRGPTLTFQDFQESHVGHPAFVSFRTKLARFLPGFLQENKIPLPGGPGVTTLRIKPAELLTQWRELRVQYACSVDWKLKTDIIRCHPDFHKRPRYDCVIVHGNPADFFARLLAIFSYKISGREIFLAYVQPYQPIYHHKNRLRSDVELELLRLREQPPEDAQFISIFSIKRGTVLIQSGEEGHRARDHFLFDLLDGDMFVRGRRVLDALSVDRTPHDVPIN